MRRLILAAICISVLAWLLYPHRTASDVSRETPTTVSPATTTPPVHRPKPAAAPKVHVASVPRPLDSGQIALKQAVVDGFDDYPAMVAVVGCESHYRQFDADGSPLISKTDDVGVAQINIPTWGKRAKAEGLDIYNSSTDNLKMARIVLKEQGINAWTCYKSTR